ncbi:MAG: hypothetical protein ACJAUL_002413 [Paraglaciecola sp.]|jgi:hypothetical protein
MNTIQQDIHEYLSMRRNLGFKLRDAGIALLNFSMRLLYINNILGFPRSYFQYSFHLMLF